jgi:hypothetical protein
MFTPDLAVSRRPKGLIVGDRLSPIILTTGALRCDPSVSPCNQDVTNSTKEIEANHHQGRQKTGI